MGRRALSQKRILSMLFASLLILEPSMTNAGSWSYTPVASSGTSAVDPATGQPRVLYGNAQPGVNQYHPTIYVPPPVTATTPSPTPNTQNQMMLQMAGAMLPAVMGMLGKKNTPATGASTNPITASNPGSQTPASAPSSPSGGPSSSTAADAPASSANRPYRGTQDEERDPGTPTGPGQSSPPSGDIMEALAKTAASGMGLNAGSGMCYRAVKAFIAKALNKNEGCLRGIITGGSAIDAHRNGSLKRAGFVDDRSKCKTQGVIRVYSGHGGGRNAKHGHIEVLGSDNKYWSFFSDYRPIDEYTRGARKLEGCYVPDPAKIAAGPLAKCGPFTGSMIGGGSAARPRAKRNSR
ncbi:MAG: hypothetical protein KF681_00495 [Bdellovibrionaceae bacterium]|nr:hypothetical protein [Pseudobdellovibrionaceae bacterium]